jgi:hypothetical protein
MKRFYEKGILDEKWVKNYCFVDSDKCVRKKLEEKGIPHSDNMLPDGTIDENLK